MAFKLKAVRNVQIHYPESYLCNKDVTLDMIFSVESVYQDDSGDTKAKLYMRVDEEVKLFFGDYLVKINPSSKSTWTDQAEAQLIASSEFAGATII